MSSNVIVLPNRPIGAGRFGRCGTGCPKG